MPLKITELEKGFWEPKWDPTINPKEPTDYHIVQTSDSLSLIMCSKEPYTGWLAKNVSELYYEAEKATLFFSILVDDATPVCGQVIETDAKITDGNGYTYDLSAQINITNDWMFQVDSPDWMWIDTGIKLPPYEPYTEYDVAIEYALDYVAKTSSVLAINIDQECFSVDPMFHKIPARECGWDHSEIVTQLQQCNNSKPGGYSLRFRCIGYDLQ